MNITVTPQPTEEEAAAIVAAVEALWPRAEVSHGEPAPTRSAWRFSGRWWSRPIPARRDRPYR